MKECEKKTAICRLFLCSLLKLMISCHASKPFLLYITKNNIKVMIHSPDNIHHCNIETEIDVSDKLLITFMIIPVKRYFDIVAIKGSNSENIGINIKIIIAGVMIELVFI